MVLDRNIDKGFSNWERKVKLGVLKFYFVLYF